MIICIQAKDYGSSTVNQANLEHRPNAILLYCVIFLHNICKCPQMEQFRSNLGKILFWKSRDPGVTKLHNLFWEYIRMNMIYLHSLNLLSISAFICSNRPFPIFALSQCDATFGLQSSRMSMAIFAIDWQFRSSSSERNKDIWLANSRHNSLLATASSCNLHSRSISWFTSFQFCLFMIPGVPDPMEWRLYIGCV